MRIIIIFLLSVIFILINTSGADEVKHSYITFSGPGKPIPYQEVPPGLKSITAESCKECHEEIYDQWKGSMHSQALVDPLFQACWTARSKPPFCTNCHFPLANQKPSLLKGFKDTGPSPFVMMQNPKFDKELFKEGVGCAVCHIRNKIIYGPQELRDGESPHPSVNDPGMEKSEFCISCHEWAMPRVRIKGICETGKEFKNSKSTWTCQDCHMQSVEGKVSKDSNVRAYRAHTANAGHNPLEIKKAIEIKVEKDKEIYKEGEEAKITIKLENSGAGHYFPTGCPLRSLEVRMIVIDETGVEQKSETFRIERVFEFPNYPAESKDKRLAPGETKSFDFDWEVPSESSDKEFTLKVDMTYYLINLKRAEEAALPLKKVILPVQTLTFPLTNKGLK
ncbi:MAG: hypothetical protein HY999_06300 [Nitrospinae bacterium]|nr:hypothetical protein [Nitrospinota bacterium]